MNRIGKTLVVYTKIDFGVLTADKGKRLADSTDLVYRGSPEAGLTRVLVCQGVSPGARLQRSGSRELPGVFNRSPIFRSLIWVKVVL